MDVDRVSTEIVSAIISEVEVIISSYDDDVENRAKESLQKAGINIDSIHFIRYPCEIPYPRDFGAEVLTDDKGNYKNIDFNFDTYGYYSPKDDISIRLQKFSQFHSNFLNIKNTLASSLVSEGGDHEFNGSGIMMSILETETTKRNPGKTKEQIESEFRRLFSIQKVIWLP